MLVLKMRYNFDKFIEYYKEARINGKDKKKAIEESLDLVAFG